jgi:hypothetical protein
MTISNVDGTHSPGGREHVVLKCPMQRKTGSRGTQPLSVTYVFIHVRHSHTPPLLDDVPVFYALLAAVPQSRESFHLPARVPDFQDLDGEPRFELLADLTAVHRVRSDLTESMFIRSRFVLSVATAADTASRFASAPPAQTAVENLPEHAAYFAEGNFHHPFAPPYLTPL